MNCTAMIEEKDAAKFLYWYSDTSLETIVDTEIKKLVEDRFNTEVALVSSTELGVKKGEIVDAVRKHVVDHFKKFGITITVLGLKEGISFENPEIQKALDKKFESEQDLVIQQNKNEANLAKAEAEAEAITIAAQAEADALRIKAEAEANAILVKGEAEANVNELLTASMSEELLAAFKYYEAWDGKLPAIIGSDTTLLKDIQGIG
jgi:regulator of protease activity HflC (stomatin/prohibitin superfamily)